jgi:hypothetical protein
MAKTSNRMLMPDDEDQEPIEIDQEAKKRWIRGEDKLPPKPVEPPPAPAPAITKMKILLTIDSDLLEFCGKAAKKKRKTRTAWIIEACMEKLERENIQ